MSTPKTALIIGASRELEPWPGQATAPGRLGRDRHRARSEQGRRPQSRSPVQIEKLDMDDQQAVIAPVYKQLRSSLRMLKLKDLQAWCKRTLF